MKILEIQKVDLASFCYLNKDRYPFLLESVNHNDNNRYSILFAFPSESIILNNLYDFDFLNKLIYFQSPVGKGLIGKNKNGLVEITTPAGVKNFEIKDVKYI